MCNFYLHNKSRQQANIFFFKNKMLSLIPALGRQRQADFWVRGQPGLQSEYQDSQGYNYIFIINASTSLLTHQLEVGERVLWTWLEVVPWGDSTLCCQDVNSLVLSPNQTGILLILDSASSAPGLAGWVLWWISLYDQQRIVKHTNTTQHCLLSVGWYSYPFQTSGVLSRATVLTTQIGFTPKNSF